MVSERRRLLPDPAQVGAGAYLTLVIRRWCSLCDAMREAAAPVAARHGFRVVDSDLDLHPDWEPRYGERVPVLVLGAPPGGEVLASLALDPADLDLRLSQLPVADSREIR